MLTKVVSITLPDAVVLKSAKTVSSIHKNVWVAKNTALFCEKFMLRPNIWRKLFLKKH